LKMRLLPATAIDEIRTTKAQIDEQVPRARHAADAALSAAPADPAAVRAEIDSLPLAGQQAAARGYVSKVTGPSSDPETAYVLAALDLAEADPPWKTIVQQLREATLGEGYSGRARAALVYALAKSGDLAGAKAELAKLDALARPYPLLPDLHALLDKPSVRSKAPAVEVAAVAAPPPAAGALMAAPAGAKPAPRSGGGSVEEGRISSDSRVAMQQASQAVRSGKITRAREIYEEIVARNPSDSEALAGLGDVARMGGDASSAITSYKQAIAVNPSYLPALLGLADTEWAHGDRTSAARGYSEIADRFPEGTYPAYVKRRIEASAAPAPAAPATGKSDSPAPPSSETVE
ncbi:MAG: tetratricopeptide repeat protein, partial [Polyangiaceae bacterium]